MPKMGLVESFNYIREHGSQDYRNAVPELDENTAIEVFTAPLLDAPKLFNEFAENLIQRIVYTQFFNKRIKQPLKVLEGDDIPLGYMGQEMFTNPALGRDFDVDDFAGALKKYEADVKVQYQGINFDKQYPVTVVRTKLKQAFVSWNALEEYIGSLTQSLVDGYRIDDYNNTKGIVTRAYLSNAVQIKKVNALNSQANIRAFTKLARTTFLNFQTPSHEYNAWTKIGGYGRFIETMTDPEDIVFLLRNDARSELDVESLAVAFNMDKAKLLGNILPVNDFNIYDRKTGKLLLDGSNILGIVCDKRWFRIRPQDEYMDDFKNANNRSINYYFNVTKMYNYSYFANAVVFATAEPELPITKLEPEETEVTLGADETKSIIINTLPFQANTPEITASTSAAEVVTASFSETNPRELILTAVGNGTGTITVTAGNVTATISVTVSGYTEGE